MDQVPSRIMDSANYAAQRLVQWRELEADVVVKLLKEARIEVSNSDARSKKVQDAMTKAAMDEYSTLPEEKDWMIDLVSMKGRIVCLCFLICSFVVSMMFLFGLGSGSSSGGPLPT
ncbi:hypothetical protein OIU84_001439 [Salix udensis]|uniref:Uncharacterized protein n=1 Tax=Salix udensis TaxID=889485 RepID=A0AAD6P602_9ROSI|nr:hypothetical protein OIU84_001439 [Salix udensis]